MTREEIEQQARMLAKDNREAEPEITKVYWFPDPHDEELRLVELLPTVPVSLDEELSPFYFRPAPSDGLPSPSCIAMIRPEEFGRLKLPSSWGDWGDAVELEQGQ